MRPWSAWIGCVMLIAGLAAQPVRAEAPHVERREGPAPPALRGAGQGAAAQGNHAQGQVPGPKTQPAGQHQPWPYGRPYYSPPPVQRFFVSLWPYVYDPYDYWYRPYPWYRYYYAPLYIPAEELYGPEAVKRFMGLDRVNVPQPALGGVAPGRGRNDPVEAEPQDPLPRKAPVARGANRDAVVSAWKFIGLGDARFSNQKFSDAYADYRKAVTVAPQLGDAFFRQGYALIAMGRYDIAARVIKRGLQLDPGWPASDFTANSLYDENQLVKKAHLEALTKAAEEKPDNADLQFLLGVFLHFDDQPDLAAPVFKRAAELAGGDDKHLRGFVDQ